MGKNKKKTQQKGKAPPTPTPVVQESAVTDAEERVQLAEGVGTEGPDVEGPAVPDREAVEVEDVGQKDGRRTTEAPTESPVSPIEVQPEPSTEDDLFGSSQQEGEEDLFASLGQSQIHIRQQKEVEQEGRTEPAVNTAGSDGVQPSTTTPLSTSYGDASEVSESDQAPTAKDAPLSALTTNPVHDTEPVSKRENEPEADAAVPVAHTNLGKDDASINEEEPPKDEGSKLRAVSPSREEDIPNRAETISAEDGQAVDDDLFPPGTDNDQSDPENIFNQPSSAPGEPKDAEPSHVENAQPKTEDPQAEDDDLFGDIPVQDPLVQEFEVAVEHVQVDATREEAETRVHERGEKGSGEEDLFAGAQAEEDLFPGPANSGEEDLFGVRTGGQDLFGSRGDTGKTDELFAAKEGPEEADDLFFGDVPATDLDFITHVVPQPAQTQEPSQEPDDLFGNAPANGLDFITAPPAPTEPSKQRVEDMDLDAAGVPQGWVDENGGWNWYTAEERLDVARGMFEDVQEAQEVQGQSATWMRRMVLTGETAQPVEEEVKHDPYAAQTASSNAYNPQPTPYAPAHAQSYAPSPLTSGVSASTSAYDPYRPAASMSPLVSAYAPAAASNAYKSYQPKVSGAHVHGQVEPPARSYSPYDPPAAVVSSPNVFKPAAPVLTASSPYSAPSVPSMPNRPAPALALNRMKTSTAYDPPMIPVAKALSRPASAAAVASPFAPSVPSGLGISGVGSAHPPPPGVTPPPPAGPPRGPSRVSSPANVATHPPVRKPQQVPSALAHPALPNAYDPPALPVMPNRPASRVATPVTTGFGSPTSPAGGSVHQGSALPPPPSRSTSAMAAPPRAPPRQPAPPVKPAPPPREVMLDVPIIQAEPPTPEYESPGPATSGSPSSLYAPPTRAAYPVPPKIAQPPPAPKVSQPRAAPLGAPPLTYGVPAPNYQAPPFSRQSSSVEGVSVRSPSGEAAPSPFPNENHARMNSIDKAHQAGSPAIEEHVSFG